MSRANSLLSFGLWAALCSASHLLAQTQSASLRGLVTDASGGIVPKSSIQLTNTEQNRSWKVDSND